MILNKKHILFDWNGTLIDDAWIFVDILNALLKKRDLNQIDLIEYQELFCFPLSDFYQNLGFDVCIGTDFLKSQTFSTSKGEINLVDVDVQDNSVIVDGKPVDLILLN